MLCKTVIAHAQYTFVYRHSPNSNKPLEQDRMKAPFSGTWDLLLLHPLWSRDMTYASVDPISTLTWKKRLQILQSNLSFFPGEGYSSSNPADLNEITEKCYIHCLNLTRSTQHSTHFQLCWLHQPSWSNDRKQ